MLKKNEFDLGASIYINIRLNSAILFKILTESRQGQSFIILENWCNGILVKIKPEDRK